MFLAVPERSLATLHCPGYKKVSKLRIGILIRHKSLPGPILLGQHRELPSILQSPSDWSDAASKKPSLIVPLQALLTGPLTACLNPQSTGPFKAGHCLDSHIFSIFHIK